MHIALIFFVINVLFTSRGHFAAAKTWRYYPVSDNTNGYFTTRTKFILEYIGSVNWDLNSWYHDDDCQVENKTLPRSIALCFKPGYHPFGIINQSLTLLEVQSIFVIETPYCYKWQMAPLPVDNSSSSEFNLKFQLWISKIGEAKDLNSSRSFSEFSRRISKIFYQIGQVPLVSATFGHSNDEATVIRHKVYFAKNNSVWEVMIMVRNLELLRIRVDGPYTTFLDCFIKPVVFEHQHDKFSFAASSGNIQVSLGEEKSELKIVQDDCTPSVIAVANDDHLILTQDYFGTNLQLTIPQNLVEHNMSSIHEAVFTRNEGFIIHVGVKTLLIVSNSSEIYPVQDVENRISLGRSFHSLGAFSLMSYETMKFRQHKLDSLKTLTDSVNRESIQIGKLMGYLFASLPNEKLQFGSNSWCHQEEGPEKTFSDVVVAWNNQSLVYISLNPTSGFTPLSLANYIENQDFKLLDGNVNGMCHCVYFLMELSNSSEYNNSKVIVYTTYEYATKAWGKFTKVLEEIQYSGKNSSWSFQFFPPNSFSMLIWNSWDVFYKSTKGELAKSIAKKSNSSVNNHGHIIQVATSNNGEYLVLYESNILYYGRIGIDYMVQLQSSFPKGPDMRMVFDLNGYARVVSVNRSNSLVATTHYPLDSEIFNAVYPTFICPFIEFSFGRPSSTNVLDKWGIFKIWGYLVYKRSEPNDIQLNWDPSAIIHITVSEQREYYQDVIMLNKTFIFTETSPETSSGAISPTSFSVTILPKINGMICKRPFHKVFHFHVGCPSSRRTIVRDVRTIQNPAFDQHSILSLELLSGDVFQPVVLLYDHNVLIKQVNSSFDVFEVNGREDFSFHHGQKLMSYVEPATVLFKGSGMFKFSLNFDDRNNSFCSTILKFSVLIKEEAETDYNNIEFICVILITILFLSFLGVNYMFYRKTFLQQHEEDDERRVRLQELQYLAQLQYYRTNTALVETKLEQPEEDLEDIQRRAALVMGKSERRSHRRSSVFERVSKGVFEDINTQRRSSTLTAPETSQEPEG